MQHRTVSDSALATAVRARLALDEADALARGHLRRRIDRLRDDGEAGAQAAEYAMLGGVSAAACSALIVLLKNQETLSRVVEAVLTALANVIGGWF